MFSINYKWVPGLGRKKEVKVSPQPTFYPARYKTNVKEVEPVKVPDDSFAESILLASILSPHHTPEYVPPVENITQGHGGTFDGGGSSGDWSSSSSSSSSSDSCSSSYDSSSSSSDSSSCSSSDF